MLVRGVLNTQWRMIFPCRGDDEHPSMDDFRAYFFTTKVGRSRRDRRTGDIVQCRYSGQTTIPPIILLQSRPVIIKLIMVMNIIDLLAFH